LKHIHTKISERLYLLLDDLSGRCGRGKGFVLESVFWVCWGLRVCREEVLRVLGLGGGSVSASAAASTGSGGSGGGDNNSGGDGFVGWLVRAYSDPRNELLWELGIDG